MRFTAMAYNIMRVFEETSKATQPEHIHPSDKKYNKALEKREKIAQEKGCFINPLFFYARIVRICSFTIRTVQNAIITGRSLIAVMSILSSHLKSRVIRAVEHWWHFQVQMTNSDYLSLRVLQEALKVCIIKVILVSQYFAIFCG